MPKYEKNLKRKEENVKQSSCFLTIVIVSLFTTGVAFAELYPLRVGYLEEYEEVGGGDLDGEIWFMTEKKNINGYDYFYTKGYDSRNPGEGVWDDHWVLRSTENTVYTRNYNGADYALFTIDDIGQGVGVGDFINVCDTEIDPTGCNPSAYLQLICENPTFPINGFTVGDNTYNNVYHFELYGCTESDGTISCLPEPGAHFWIAEDYAIIRKLYNEGDGYWIDELLVERRPPKIRWYTVNQIEHENGHVENRITLELTYAIWLTDDMWASSGLTKSVSLEDFITHPNSTVELFHNGTAMGISNEYVTGYYDYTPGFVDADNVFFWGPWEYRLDDFLAEADTLSDGTYMIKVTDGDGIIYERETNYSHATDSLPMISAKTFETAHDNGNIIWNWTSEEALTDAHFRMGMVPYRGESLIGWFLPRYEYDDNEIIIPINSLPDGCNRLKLNVQIRHNSYNQRTYSNYISIPRFDSDDDGISDFLDDSPDSVSVSFSEPSQDPTYGLITDPADQVISVTDAASSTDGVLLSAYRGDDPATVSICGGSATIELTNGDEIVVKCGSAIVKVLNGDVEASFFKETSEGSQLVAKASLAGDDTSGDENIIKFEPDTGTFSVPGSNTTPVEAEFYDDAGEPIATVELVGDLSNEDDNSITFESETGTFTVPETNTMPMKVILDDGTEVSLEPGDEFLPVDINIRPFSRRNTIVLWHWGFFPVAILSNPDLDAANNIDETSITFGQTGDEDSLVFCRNRTRDINGDGMEDLICIFRTRDTGFEAGDTIGLLKGETVDGIRIQGTDLVRIIDK